MRVRGRLGREVAVGGFLADDALARGLSASWGERCFPDEPAGVERLRELALEAPFLVVGLYAALDLATLNGRCR